MKQEEIKVDVIDVDELIPDNHNFNKGCEQGAQLLERSFRECGAGRSVLIDKDNRLVGGNKAQKGFKAAGKKKVIIVDSDADTLVAVRRKDVSLDSAEGRKMAYLDNLTTQVNLTWDQTELEAVQADVEGFDIADFGFDIEDLPQVTFPTGEKQGEGEGKPQTEVKEDDFDPDAHYETKVKAGEVWQLGEHRLMCGDSTDADAVAKLMNGEQADMTFTDPPYNIAYSGVNDKRTIKNDKMSDDDFVDFLSKSIMKLDTAYVCCSWQYAHLFKRAMENIGMPPKAMIVWNKVHAAQHLDKYYKQHELIWYFGKFGGQKTLRGDIWEVPREPNTVHPTMKPLTLIGIALQDQPDKVIVYDGFGGSGSTMIACEQLGRKCRMMELDPHYCTVIIARWEKLTGQKAIKLNP